MIILLWAQSSHSMCRSATPAELLSQPPLLLGVLLLSHSLSPASGSSTPLLLFSFHPLGPDTRLLRGQSLPFSSNSP